MGKKQLVKAVIAGILVLIMFITGKANRFFYPLTRRRKPDVSFSIKLPASAASSAAEPLNPEPLNPEPSRYFYNILTLYKQK